jgi:hypothetical protein
MERAVAAVAEERDVGAGKWALLMAELRDLAEEVTPFAFSAPFAEPPDPARLSIAVVDLAYAGWTRRALRLRRTVI